MERVISIAKDFSVYPGGRTPDDGPYSGQEFRDQFLIPSLESREHVIVDFDGTRGYGSSFLEEAFGGLVRCGYSRDDIVELISFSSSRESIIEEVQRYIDAAQARK